jgi:pimeloyl-ACP methyl ester carboxylesterase
MAKLLHAQGYFPCGMPYDKFGGGARILVIFQGLVFENKPMAKFMTRLFTNMYGPLQDNYTVYIVNRKPGMPEGYTMKDMADDYAAMIREEFGGPVYVMGASTGGSIVQHFAADHPDLTRRLVIQSSAYTLNEAAKKGQMRCAELARQRKWTAAFTALMGISLPEKGFKRMVLKPAYWLLSLFAGPVMGIPKDPTDLAVTIEAEDKHDFKDRLSEIKAPIMVIAGDKDPFYSEKLFRETAEGIPNARLVLYQGMGHPASGKQFKKDLRAFLDEDM